ncbi:MAG: argininosuccinate lyase [Acidaminococcaceae bacterium]|nr:argininosuccinate lyase [Acidaminococcaceae bacterium]
MPKLWGGRFSKETSEWVDAYNASVSYDKRLYREDIRGSIAHATMLARQGIISKEDGEQIVDGLQKILQLIKDGKFEFSQELEDIHMNIEARLTEMIGAAGARVHSARSRNDQVALDMHMYMKRVVARMGELLILLEEVILGLARGNCDTIMPGYTHLQRAQPITFAHNMLAYLNMFKRDFDRLKGVWKRADMMPLGAGAIAGSTLPIDRQFVAEQLNFSDVYYNSMDAISDRDYIIEFLSFASILMMHVSRLSEEICLWSSTEFNFIELDDAYATGSSMMPQKKNPDIPELVRGKTGRVYGTLMQMLVTMKGLPLAYNKDLQEDKEGFFDVVDTLRLTLVVLRDMLATMTLKKDKMRDAVYHDFSNATDLAEYLVKKGVPFRQAHEIVGKTVAYAIEQGKFLGELTLEEFRQHGDIVDEDIYEAIKPETCVNARISFGGPNYNLNRAQCATGKKFIGKQRQILRYWQNNM